MERVRRSILVLLLSMGVAGCAPCLDCGSLVKNHQITRDVEQLTIQPEYRYYYSGVELEPDAIIGVLARYSVTGGYWNEVEMTPTRLKKWLATLGTLDGKWDDIHDMIIHYQGAAILTPQGEKIGIWYSKFDWTVVKFPGQNRLVLYPPDSGTRVNVPFTGLRGPFGREDRW